MILLLGLHCLLPKSEFCASCCFSLNCSYGSVFSSLSLSNLLLKILHPLVGVDGFLVACTHPLLWPPFYWWVVALPCQILPQGLAATLQRSGHPPCRHLSWLVAPGARSWLIPVALIFLVEQPKLSFDRLKGHRCPSHAI